MADSLQTITKHLPDRGDIVERSQEVLESAEQLLLEKADDALRAAQKYTSSKRRSSKGKWLLIAVVAAIAVGVVVASKGRTGAEDGRRTDSRDSKRASSTSAG